MNKFDAIIFDMDGLLVDSETVWFAAETEMIEARGHKYTDDVREQIVGMRINEYFSHLRNVYNLEESVEELTAELTDRMLELIPVKVNPQPGAQDLLDWVQKNQITCAIASSSSKVIIEKTIQSKGWDKLFTIYCSAEDDNRGKPAPDVYLRTAKRLNVDPRACLALEDSPNGARAAVAAGMTCYAVPDPSHSQPEAFDGITPHVFPSLIHVLKSINSM